MELKKEYWDQRYRQNDTPWDIGFASPPIRNYLDQLEDKNLDILIPGAGNAHEAQYALEAGFPHVYICDWSQTAIQKFLDANPQFPAAQAICADFFDLSIRFDRIIEQTFFCSLPVDQRSRYVEKAHSLLKQDGKLAGVLFASEFDHEGPPFGGTKSEYEKLFRSHFTLEVLEPCYNSILPRQGNELFILFEKQPLIV